MYNNAEPYGDKMLALILFGIKYSDEIKSMTCTRKELYRMAGVGLSNVEVDYGIKLNSYVEIVSKPDWL